MADFQRAIPYTLENEGGLYEDPKTGEVSKFGISLKWLQSIDPEATADTIRNLTQPAAVDLYKVHWWDQYKFGLIPSDRLGTKLFDTAVNCGAITAIKLFQAVLNDGQEATITVDGMIGPATVKAVTNELGWPKGEQQLLMAFAADQANHYEEIVANNPEEAHNLPDWLARAEKLPS